MTASANRLRCIVFTGGPELDHQVLTFIDHLEQDPTIDLAAVFSESPQRGLVGVWLDLWRRRGVMGVPIALTGLLSALWLKTTSPGRARLRKRVLRAAAGRIHYVTSLQDPVVWNRVAELQPDLGLVYGGPIIKPELFRMPKHGTLGIHHGVVPQYRGKKTTFWAIYNGEDHVGVTIQRLGDRLDGGDVVMEAKVPVDHRPLPMVRSHLEKIGIELYVAAVRRIHDGTATFTPQPRPTTTPYRDPTVRDVLEFWRRYAASLLRPQPQPARPPRLYLLTETFHPITGGGESQAKTIARGLAERGWSVHVLTRQPSHQLPKQELLGPIHVHRLGPGGPGSWKKWPFAAAAWLFLLRKARGSDQVLVCGFRVLGVPAVTACRLSGTPCVLKADLLGEFDGEVFQRKLPSRIGNARLPRWLLARRANVLAKAQRMVSISTPVRAELLAAGVPDTKIVEIPNSVNVDVYRPVDTPTKARLRKELGFSDACRLAVYTGRLEDTKGLPTLLQAWATVVEGRPNAHLALIGSGGLGSHNCESTLRQFVEQRGLQERVTFTGSVDNVHEYLQAADLFVFPSHRESFGISVVEAMACGLPIISTAPGGLADVLSDPSLALIVAPEDPGALAAALAQMLDETHQNLGQCGPGVARSRYADSLVIEKYHQLFSEIAASSTTT